MTPSRRLIFALAICAFVTLDGCARSVTKVDLPAGSTDPSSIDELWQLPENLSGRDLFFGPGGPGLVPHDTSFAFVARDTTGFSPGYDVRDAAGVEWDVKLGLESQTEVVTSRVLWAIGFHQPPTYYLDRWTLTGVESGPQAAGRFRPTVPQQQAVADWSWYENPFVGSRPFAGLVVANLILNNWDWKTSNNKVYALAEPMNGVRRHFVVRDVGASLGKTTYSPWLKWFRLRGFGQGTRNDLAGFESQSLINRIRSDGSVDFDYRGMYRDVLKVVRPADVQWTCELLAQVSDAQWHDAFRAGGFAEDQRARYIRKIKAKVAEGLALQSN